MRLNLDGVNADGDAMISTVSAPVFTSMPEPRDLDPCTLGVVMPVYNEEESLSGCVRSWVSALDELDIDYRLIVINDGSKDSTADVLGDLVSNPRVVGVSKANEGHGPTILRGYHLAARTSEWVFQVDSDDEIPASAFAAVWNSREGHDAVFGRRTGREQTLDRKLISKIAGLTSRLLLRGRVTDVNVPYRLMRSTTLLPVIDRLPADTFAPNVVISGALGRDRATFAEVPVPHSERAAGEVSIVGWGAIKAAVRSFRQTVKLARSF